MGNHRADVTTDIPDSVTPPPADTGGYVGRRRAAVPVDDAPAVVPATYVGKRRAAAPVEIPVETAVEELPEDARITTGEIRALVDAALQDTAPRPRIRMDDVPPVFTVPEPRHEITLPADDDTRPATQPRSEPRSEPRSQGERLFRDVSADSLIDLPRISVAATYAADLSGDTTTLLPVITDGGRRRARTSRATARHRRVSMPIIAGVAATLAAVGGVVLTAHPSVTTAVDTQLRGASALTGTTAVAAVGAAPGRTGSVSRDDDRSAAQDAADARARALGNLDADAAGQQKYLSSNRWGLPITAGGYHLTGRFGDVSGLWATIHTGLDFACPTGTPIHAIQSGTITDVGWAGAYGNRTVETLADGTEIWYAHQSAFGTSVGAKVTEGQVIGFVGATGNVTGPHVHIEVRPGGGDPVDPDPAFKAHGVDPDASQ